MGAIGFDTLISRVKDKKIMITSLRYALLSFLYNSSSHPTVNAIFNDIKSKMPNTTLAAIYKNLSLFEREGFVLEFALLGEKHYDLMTESHDHFLCVSCKKIIDLSTSPDTPVDERFGVINYSTAFHVGICKECQNMEKI